MSNTINLSAILGTPFNIPLDESAVKQIVAAPPFLPIPNALNLRTLSAPSLQPGLVFRSGSLTQIPASSLALLNEEYKISTVFDLRGKEEREKYPSPEIPGIETIWIPSSADAPLPTGAANGSRKQVLSGIGPADFATNNGVDGFIVTYGNVLDIQKDAFRAVFEKLKEPQGGVLFHCTAGKDRTGVLAALILGLLDAPPEVIARDYVLTRVGTEPFRDHLLGVLIHWMKQKGIENPFEVPGFEELCGVRGPTIIAVLKWMGEKWGEDNSTALYPGVHGYLKEELGFSEDELEQIRSSLTARSVQEREA